jgi:hypothetical protein
MRRTHHQGGHRAPFHLLSAGPWRDARAILIIRLHTIVAWRVACEDHLPLRANFSSTNAEVSSPVNISAIKAIAIKEHQSDGALRIKVPLCRR